jgi:hypothetical protein
MNKKKLMGVPCYHKPALTLFGEFVLGSILMVLSFVNWKNSLLLVLLTLQGVTLYYNVKICLKNLLQNMSCFKIFLKK